MHFVSKEPSKPSALLLHKKLWDGLNGCTAWSNMEGTVRGDIVVGARLLSLGGLFSLGTLSSSNDPATEHHLKNLLRVGTRQQQSGPIH